LHFDRLLPGYDYGSLRRWGRFIRSRTAACADITPLDYGRLWLTQVCLEQMGCSSVLCVVASADDCYVLSLLGWVDLVHGSFQAIEVAMTVIVGLASLIAIVSALRLKSSVRPWPTTGIVLLVAVLQLPFSP